MLQEDRASDPIARVAFYATTALNWAVTLVLIAICICAIYFAVHASQDNIHQDTRMKTIEDRESFNNDALNASLCAKIMTVNSTLSGVLDTLTSSNDTSTYILDQIVDIKQNITSVNTTLSDLLIQVDSMVLNISDESTARIAKDMILMQNVTDLQTSVSQSIKRLNTKAADENGLFTLTGTNGLTVTAGGTDHELYITLANTAVTPWSYTYATITVDAQGRLTSATDNGNAISLIETKVLALMTSVDMLNMTSLEMSVHNLTAFNQTLVSLISNVMFLMTTAATVREVTAGTGLETVAGVPITTTGTIKLADTSVTAGSYVHASITVDAQGRITSAGDGAVTSGTVTSVATGTGLEIIGGSPITSTGTIKLADTSVTAGSYVHASITVDAQGRITSAGDGASGGLSTNSVIAPLAGQGTTGGIPNFLVFGTPIYDPNGIQVSSTFFTLNAAGVWLISIHLDSIGGTSEAQIIKVQSSASVYWTFHARVISSGTVSVFDETMVIRGAAGDSIYVTFTSTSATTFGAGTGRNNVISISQIGA